MCIKFEQNRLVYHRLMASERGDLFFEPPCRFLRRGAPFPCVRLRCARVEGTAELVPTSEGIRRGPKAPFHLHSTFLHMGSTFSVPGCS